MKNPDTFVEQFREDPDSAAHLFSIKEWYRKGKIAVFGYTILIYVLVIVLGAFNVDSDNTGAVLVVGGFGILGVLLILFMFILFLDGARYGLTDEDLTCHEFAMAVEGYRSDPPNYGEWQRHLMNAATMLDRHNPEIFSKHRKEEVTSYISRVEERDGDGPSKSTFEEFYNKRLYPLLEEREGDIDDVLKELKTTESSTQGPIETVQSSLKNLASSYGTKLGVQLVFIFAAGGGIAVYNRSLGISVLIVGLTALSIVRSERSNS